MSRVERMDEFIVARNPDDGSTLPYLVRIPLPRPVILKVKDTWPRTNKIYCHPSTDWPRNPEIVERVAVRSCNRRGAAIDLVLDRAQLNRSQFVFTKARGRDMIFWQSARTNKQARPNVKVPKARASGRELHILIDSMERYAWNFADQQATTEKRKLPAGDYAVEMSGRVVASVERKSLPDFVATMTSGKLWFLLADLAAVGKSALVVEDRYSQVFNLDRVRPTVVLEGIAEAAVRYPAVPIVFAENRKLAQEWTYRFLGAAVEHHETSRVAETMVSQLPTSSSAIPSAKPATRAVRAWARANGLEVPDRGRLRPEIWAAYEEAHPHVSGP